MPTPSKTTTDTPQRRQPIKRQKVGGVTISIIRDGAAFMVIAHHPSGRRTRERHATLAEASTAFALRTAAVGRDGIEVAGAAESGDLRAIHEFRAATADWPTKPSVETALRFYVEHQRVLKIAGTVQQAVDARMEDAFRRQLSKRSQYDLKMRLGRFARDFGTRALASVTTEEIRSYIQSEATHPKTMANIRLSISSIFSAAYLSGQITRNPVLGVKLPRIVLNDPEVINAKQLAAILEAAPERSRAAIAIQALSGLRASEVLRLDWAQVSLPHLLITVSAKKAKTASRRHVPVCDALAEWITPLHQGKGTVAVSENILKDDFMKARQKAGVTDWQYNSLRHTCASAWCCVESDVARVAAWLGNSPAVVHQHYRALLTHEQATAWFNVRPPSFSDAKVVPFQVAG